MLQRKAVLLVRMWCLPGAIYVHNNHAVFSRWLLKYKLTPTFNADADANAFGVGDHLVPCLLLDVPLAPLRLVAL